MAALNREVGQAIFYPFRSVQESEVLGSGGDPLMSEPWSFTSTSKFRSWYRRIIKDVIQDFEQQCSRAMSQVGEILRRQMPLSVKVIIKGGSLGKGTMLKGISDIDCVVMINSPDLPYLRNVSNMSDYVHRELAKANRSIEQAIKDHATVVSTKRNEYMVKTTLKVSGVNVDVDLIPTADNLTAEGKPQIYESMLARSRDDREFYSVSLVKLQVDFIKTKPGVLKELTRLVKYWNKHVVGYVLKDKWPLPTSYPMELITIFAWERAGSLGAFDRLQGFKAVLSIIATELPTLNKHWTCNYNESMVQRARSVMDSASKRRPFILDPANPTNNVCARFHSTWNDVAGVAQQTLSSKLLSQVRVNPSKVAHIRGSFKKFYLHHRIFVILRQALASANQSIEKAIEKNATVIKDKTNKYMVKATLKVSGHSLKFDLIPTADNLTKEGKPKIYESMLRRTKDDREFYSASLVKLQVHFIKTKPVGVKELIRLLKYWNSQVVGSARRPMELITILAWERVGSPRSFNRLQGFKAVLTIIATELKTLNTYWTCNYDESMVRRASQKMDSETKRRPFILDPANPTNNVCARFHSTWNDVARVAQQTLRSNLLTQVQVNEGWKK
ncbi:2'-5'-oligoadenylate synthase 2-like [Amphiura filiformis]|uniref:2'-5'-oligoadenylate synthase 2-like n=1 Tax=Amphiura filiformis TaxID=82378 RepID=UPI003B20D6F2